MDAQIYPGYGYRYKYKDMDIIDMDIQVVRYVGVTWSNGVMNQTRLDFIESDLIWAPGPLSSSCVLDQNGLNQARFHRI